MAERAELYRKIARLSVKDPVQISGHWMSWEITDGVLHKVVCGGEEEAYKKTEDLRMKFAEQMAHKYG